MISRNKSSLVFAIFEVLLMSGWVFSQALQNPSTALPPNTSPRINKTDSSAKEPPIPKKLGENLVQIGNITVDTQKKELTVKGRMLPTTSTQDSASAYLKRQLDGAKVPPPPPPKPSTASRTLEYLATSRNGMKAYESAMELDTDATTFNFALIMIGLDKARAVLPKSHFDSAQAKGDPVEIWVEWENNKVRAEELLYDQRTKAVPKLGEWVYTGSVVLSDGRYLAEVDGCLIGFVHDPDTIIENSTGGGLSAYGAIQLNPNLKLSADTAVKLTIKALKKRETDK
jgi:hypothetical protein